ncbi:MAG TPA: hypothetical protein VKU19_38705 [Bryobacteraceae bacterium]|nr:hypothetical protein [Bryobacteraceae bacterium]
MFFRAVVSLTVLAWSLPAQSPPPMFSASYNQALRDILKLEEADRVTLERNLAVNPEDYVARLKLMAYEARADRLNHPEDRDQRVRHTIWLIAHHPESEILHSYVSGFSRKELSDADYQRAVALWDTATRANQRNARIQWNAASFFRNLDAGLYLQYLEATAAADPNHPFAIRPLAELYALSILNGGPQAARARAGLDASRNMWVVSNAAYVLQCQYNLTVQRGALDRRVAELAEHYFLRAQAIDPTLDRQKILPQLPSGPAPTPAAEPVRKTARLPVGAFPSLPPAIAGVLRARGCLVPQPTAGGPRRNVIRGDFFARGETGWAVLCSAGNRTSLLAFRNDRDVHPDNVASGVDSDNSRELTAVGRDFIMGHYRAYGGPEPPPIDHQGIDDSFLEKASITWYYFNGKWRQLQGAD